LLKATFQEWNAANPSRLGAALAYFTVFSLGPLLIVVIAVAGLIWGQQAVSGQLYGQMRGLVGDGAATTIQAMVQGASKPSSGILGTVIGTASLLFGAAGLFGQLKGTLNTVWGVQPPNRGLIGTILSEFLSFTAVVGTGFILLVSLVLSAIVAALAGYLDRLVPGISVVIQVVNFVISFGVVTLLFAMIYKVLPDLQISWSDVWIGAAVTALLFTIGKFLIGLYLGYAGVGSSIGAAGSLLVILIWTYYTAQILLLGAQFTHVYAQTYGSHPLTTPAPQPTPVAPRPSRLDYLRHLPEQQAFYVAVLVGTVLTLIRVLQDRLGREGRGAG
jgi:membrane protein